MLPTAHHMGQQRQQSTGPHAAPRPGGSAGCWWPGRGSRRPTSARSARAVSASTSDPASSNGVHDQRSTGRLASVTHGGQQRGPPPRRRDVDDAGQRPQTRWVQVSGERLTGHVGNGQRHQQRGAHRPCPGRDRSDPQRAVAVGVQNAVVLRRNQERRRSGRSRPRPRRRSHPRPGRTAGPIVVTGPGIGQSGGGQRGGQRQRPDARGGASGQRRHPDEQRPRRCAAASAPGIIVIPRV